MSEFTMKWKRNGRDAERQLEKEPFFKMLRGAKLAYPDNNEVSSRILKFEREMTAIVVNFDRNRDNPESPMINVVTPEGNHMILVQNAHKIIWGILNEYCK